MTAVKIKPFGGAPQRMPRPPFLEVFTRRLIILCTALAVVLSSIAVCDGHWLLAGDQMFGLWQFCTLGGAPNCTTSLAESWVHGVETCLGLCRLLVSVAVVGAIFGLELLVMSQVSEGRDAGRRWCFGAALVLLAAALAAGGMAAFAFLLRAHASPLGFTLTFWCQFTATFLFLLNGMAALHIQHMAVLLPPGGDLRKL